MLFKNVTIPPAIIPPYSKNDLKKFLNNFENGGLDIFPSASFRAPELAFAKSVLIREKRIWDKSGEIVWKNIDKYNDASWITSVDWIIGPARS